MKFDFSQFHPLDHHALDPVCARYYGGFRKHVELWVSYQIDFLWPWHKLRCLTGKHDEVPYWNSNVLDDLDETGKPNTKPAGLVCQWCRVYE